MKFQRGIEPMESMGIGQKVHLEKISCIEARFCTNKTWGHRDHHAQSKIIGDINIIRKRDGARTLKALAELGKRGKIKNMGWHTDVAIVDENKRILFDIFPKWLMDKVDIGVLNNMSHVVINYRIASEDQNRGIIGKTGGDVVWKATDEIYPILVNEIHFNKWTPWP